jgi:hypothetical protein
LTSFALFADLGVTLPMRAAAYHIDGLLI